MGATVFEIAGGSARPPPLVKGVGTKRLGKGRVKPKTLYQNFLVKWNQLKKIKSSKNQGGAWYAEAVDCAVIRKLEKIKTLQGFKKFSGWKSRRSLQWVTQGMSNNCKRSIKANL